VIIVWTHLVEGGSDTVYVGRIRGWALVPWDREKDVEKGIAALGKELVRERPFDIGSRAAPPVVLSLEGESVPLAGLLLLLRLVLLTVFGSQRTIIRYIITVGASGASAVDTATIAVAAFGQALEAQLRPPDEAALNRAGLGERERTEEVGRVPNG
jgi:hypothetical protein